MTIDFATLATKNKNDFNAKSTAAAKAQKAIDDERIAIYNAAIKELQPILSTCGFVARLHTDKNHYPCPAIHIDSTNRGVLLGGSYSDYVSEIGFDLKSKTWFFGSCNQHRYNADNVEAIKLDIATRLAKIFDIPEKFAGHEDAAFRTMYKLSQKRIEDNKAAIIRAEKNRLDQITMLDDIVKHIKPTLVTAGLRFTFKTEADSRSPAILIFAGSVDYIEINADVENNNYYYKKGISYMTEKLSKDDMLVKLAKRLAPYL